jgi:hypothetical protein
MLKKILAISGLVPGFFGGLAVPLALLIASKLPGSFQLENLVLNQSNLISLFILMPPLGAITGHFMNNKIHMRQFLTGVCAPAVILGSYLLYNASIKNRIAVEVNRTVNGQNEVLEDRVTNQLGILESVSTTVNSSVTSLPQGSAEFLNGVTAQ